MIKDNDLREILRIICSINYRLSEPHGARWISSAFSCSKKLINLLPDVQRECTLNLKSIIELSKYRCCCPEDFHDRAVALEFRSRIFSGAFLYECFDPVMRRFDQLKFFRIILSDSRITNSKDLVVLKHINMFFLGEEKKTAAKVGKKLKCNVAAVTKRAARWDRCARGIMKQLLLLKDYFIPSVLTEQPEYIIMNEELATDLNNKSGGNFSPVFYDMLIQEQNSGIYRSFKLNGDHGGYLLLKLGFITSESEAELTQHVCAKSGRLYSQSKEIKGNFVQNGLLDLLVKLFQVDLKIQPGSIICSKSKWSRYTREIQSIIPTEGMHENEILKHLHERGYADMTKNTLRKVLKKRKDLFKRKGMLII